MKTTKDTSCLETTHHDELDALVIKAALGDRRAVGAIAVAFGPTLLAIARRETKRQEDAEDVVQDLYLGLLEGCQASFRPRRGRGLAWLGGLSRAMARARRRGGAGKP